jgi:hypothetical protein
MLRWLVIFICIVIAAVIWWLAYPSPSQPVAPAASTSTLTTAAPPSALAVVGCLSPSQLAGNDGVVQSDAPGNMTPFQLRNAIAKPLAGFSVAARVLSRKAYDQGREADFSPLDLALGWGRMRDDAVLSQLDISQSGRFYRYRWSRQPPIPQDAMARSSANMHMVPSNSAVAAALDVLNAGDDVRIDGWLVQIEASNGWRWRSSLTRDDTGANACEVIYVCGVTRR